MRVSGLASGIDIDSLVKQMMTAKRAPLDKLNQNKQILEWRRDSYKTVNSALVDFRQNKLDTFRKTSEMNVYSAEVSGNKDAISVKATTSSNQVPMKVEVEKLATQTTLKSASLPAGTTRNTKIGDLNLDEDPLYLKITSGNQTVTVDFKKDETIQDVLTKLNGDPTSGVTATFDEAGRNIIIKSKEYGSDTVKFEGSLLTETFKEPDPDKQAKYTTGQNADVTINGMKYTPSSNQLTVNGVQITLLQVTGTNGVSEITTKPDGKKALETIKSFIANYNSLIDTLNSKVSEERFRSYAPLSAEQKKDMTDDDIKNWESRAKSGLLRNDDILVEGLSSMRTLLSSSSVKLGDKSFGLASIGITTGTYTENGALYLNEEKLMKAMEENPEQVMELFIGSSDGSTKGIFDNMYDKLNVTLSRISDKAGTSKYSTDTTLALSTQSTLGKELTDLNSRISELTKKLMTFENNYYNQFTAMEKAINKLNSQSASLAGFTG